MKLFDKLYNQIDFNNAYTIKRTMGIIESEFNLAIKNKNFTQARDMFITMQKIYEAFSSTYRESSGLGATMSYSQMIWAKRMRGFLNFMENTIKKNMNIIPIKNLPINDTDIKDLPDDSE